MREVVISEFVDDAAIHDGLAGFEVVYDPKLVDDPSRLHALAARANALIVRNRTQVRGDLLASAKRLKAVGRLGVGLDNIDTDACEARGIAVFPATDPSPPLPLDALLATSDVISLHVPLTRETRAMIDAEAIAKMRRGTILINAARGGVVDEATVAQVLKTGHLGGAALDATHGSIFQDVPNLVLTPHIAGVTVESNVRVSHVTADAVRRHLKGV